MTDHHDRRSLLRAGAALCSFGVAGCLDSGDGGDSASDSTGSETGADDSTGSDTGTNGTDTDGTDTDGNATDPGGEPEPEPVTSWPMQQYDARNTGAVPDAAAPTENVGKLWSVELDARIDASPVVADGTVDVGDRSGTVHALDAENGDTQWTASVPGEAVRGTAAVYEDLLIIPHDEGAVGLDRDGGGREWTFDTVSGATDITIAEDAAVFGDTGDFLHAVEAGTGDERWRYGDERDLEEFRHAPAVHDGEVFSCTYGPKIVAVEIESGESRTIHTAHDFGYRTPVSIQDGEIFVGSTEGVQCLEGIGGIATERWHFDTDDPVRAGLSATDKFVYGMSTDGAAGEIFSVNIEMGNLDWSNHTTNAPEVGAIVVGEELAFANRDLQALGLDRQEGEKRWEVDATFSVFYHSAFADDSFIFSAAEHQVIAVGEN